MKDRFGDRWKQNLSKKTISRIRSGWGLAYKPGPLKWFKSKQGRKGMKVLILLLLKLPVNNLDIFEYNFNIQCYFKMEIKIKA